MSSQSPLVVEASFDPYLFLREDFGKLTMAVEPGPTNTRQIPTGGGCWGTTTPDWVRPIHHLKADITITIASCGWT